MIGRPRVHHRVTDSTNERAKELAAAGAPHGTLVTADEQTAGRGRQGRAWTAPPGDALLLSLVLRELSDRHALVPLAAAVAVCEACEATAAVECAIKWPNDVWIDRRKVAGILIEARPPHWAVIGIGVNVAIAPQEFPADLRWPATSLGGAVAVSEVRDAVSAALGRWVDAPAAAVLDAYRGRDALSGREISWEHADGGGSGEARGIDERGNLLVEIANGERVSLGSGEVTLRIATR